MNDDMKIVIYVLENGNTKIDLNKIHPLDAQEILLKAYTEIKQRNRMLMDIVMSTLSKAESEAEAKNEFEDKEIEKIEETVEIPVDNENKKKEEVLENATRMDS